MAVVTKSPIHAMNAQGKMRIGIVFFRAAVIVGVKCSCTRCREDRPIGAFLPGGHFFPVLLFISIKRRFAESSAPRQPIGEERRSKSAISRKNDLFGGSFMSKNRPEFDNTSRCTEFREDENV